MLQVSISLDQKTRGIACLALKAIQSVELPRRQTLYLQQNADAMPTQYPNQPHPCLKTTTLPSSCSTYPCLSPKLLITPSKATSATALAGKALKKQGTNPLQNPLAPPSQ